MFWPLGARGRTAIPLGNFVAFSPKGQGAAAHGREMQAAKAKKRDQSESANPHR